ncbi:MAG: phytase precursor [Bacteroidota bacterium]
MTTRKTSAIFILGVALYASACSEKKSGSPVDQLPEVMVEETYFTVRDTLNNVDTPAIWHQSETQTWLLATAKETDKVLAYDASTGSALSAFAESGSGSGQLARPNSIAVLNDLAFVVERDNHRVQVFRLPEFTPIGDIGSDVLRRPYGLTLFLRDNQFVLYVTDNYETPDEQIPPSDELGKRVHRFNIMVSESGIQTIDHQYFGATSGPGVLYKVESLYADTAYNRLLIADEWEREISLKVYDLDGNFTGTVVGKDIFESEPEGIALYSCDGKPGYWIATDQSFEKNVFIVFDQETLTPLGSFIAKNTQNTDGIALTQQAFEGFPNGAFFAVHNDGNISATSWDVIADALSLKQCTP